MPDTRTTDRGFRGPGEPDLAKLNRELLSATWETRWLDADGPEESGTRSDRHPTGHA